MKDTLELTAAPLPEENSAHKSDAKMPVVSPLAPAKYELGTLPAGVCEHIASYLPLNQVAKLRQLRSKEYISFSRVLMSQTYCKELIRTGRIKDAVKLACDRLDTAQEILGNEVLAKEFSNADLLKIISAHESLAFSFIQQCARLLDDAQILEFCKAQPKVLAFVTSQDNGLNSLFLQAPDLFLNHFSQSWEYNVPKNLLDSVDSSVLKKHIITKEQLLFCLNHDHTIFSANELYDLIQKLGLTKSDTYQEGIKDAPAYSIPLDPIHLCLVCVLDRNVARHVLNNRELFELLTPKMKEFICLKDEHVAKIALRAHGQNKIELDVFLKSLLLDTFPKIAMFDEEYAHASFDGMLLAHKQLSRHVMEYESIALRFAKRYVNGLRYNWHHMELMANAAIKYPSVRAILLSSPSDVLKLQDEQLSKIPFHLDEIESLLKKIICAPFFASTFIAKLSMQSNNWVSLTQRFLYILVPNKKTTSEILFSISRENNPFLKYYLEKFIKYRTRMYSEWIAKIVERYPDLIQPLLIDHAELIEPIASHYNYIRRIVTVLKGEDQNQFVSHLFTKPTLLNEYSNNTLVYLAKINIKMFEGILSTPTLLAKLTDLQLSQICLHDLERLKFFMTSPCGRTIQLNAAENHNSDVYHYFYSQVPNPKLNPRIDIPPEAELDAIPMAILSLRDPDKLFPKHQTQRTVFDSIHALFKADSLVSSMSALRVSP